MDWIEEHFGFLLALILILLVAFPTTCQMRRDKLAVDAVLQGADPVAVKCLFGNLGEEGNTAMCVLYVERSR